MIALLKELEQQGLAEAGKEMHRFAADLYPICRSITGNGIRETLKRIQKLIPLQTYEVESGTPVFDWTVPKEWNVRDAYIKDAAGRRVVDFQQNSLHVLNYSTSMHTKLPLNELNAHLFTLPNRPDWIPYRTSYYKPEWGFCLTHKQL